MNLLLEKSDRFRTLFMIMDRWDGVGGVHYLSNNRPVILSLSKDRA
jgi:hypothetical protein